MSAEKTIGATLTKTAPGDEIALSGLTSIGEIGVESSEIDVTSLDSSGGYREFVASLKDAGELPLAGFIKDEDDFEDMKDLADEQTLCYWEIEFTSGAKWWFYGFVKIWKEAETPVEGARGFTGSIRISGEPVYAQTGVSA